MFIDMFESLCEARGEAPSKVAEKLGLTRSSYSGWKKGSEPSNPTKKKIADYFGISVKQLMSGEIETAPATKAGAEDQEMAELLEEIRRRPDLKVLFSLSKNTTPEEVRRSIRIIKAICGDDDNGTSDY